MINYKDLKNKDKRKHLLELSDIIIAMIIGGIAALFIIRFLL